MINTFEEAGQASVQTEAAAKPRVTKTIAKPTAKRVAKPATKTASKAAAKPAVKAAAKPAAKVKPVVANSKPAAKPASKPVGKKAAVAAPVKAAKIKVVRDSFTMPSDEYAVLGKLKQRALAAAHHAKKSELLRAGIKLLAGLDDAALLRALATVPAIKTGRPKAKKAE